MKSSHGRRRGKNALGYFFASFGARTSVVVSFELQFSLRISTRDMLLLLTDVCRCQVTYF